MSICTWQSFLLLILVTNVLGLYPLFATVACDIDICEQLLKLKKFENNETFSTGLQYEAGEASSLTRLKLNYVIKYMYE